MYISEWQIVLIIYSYTVNSNCCGCHENSFRFSVLIGLLIWYKSSNIYSADLHDSISHTAHAGWFWYRFHQLGASILKIIYIYIYNLILMPVSVCVYTHTHTYVHTHTDISVRLLLDQQYSFDYIVLTDSYARIAVFGSHDKSNSFYSCFFS